MYLGICKGAVGDAAECGARRVLYCAALGGEDLPVDESFRFRQALLAPVVLEAVEEFVPVRPLARVVLEYVTLVSGDGRYGISR